MNSSIIIKNEQELESVAASILSWLGSNKILCLIGEMGAGKTTLIRYIIKQLAPDVEVSSPTFSIINEYPVDDKMVYHMDLYRIKYVEELRALPLSDYLESDNLCLIEWPQIAFEELPEDIRVLKIEIMENGNRKVVLL
jgi:tRNA threonylcarbamoyladenosine biosynthesis protein TsaE